MKLRLSKKWFDTRIQPDEDFQVGAGVPADARKFAEEPLGSEKEPTSGEECAETLAFGTLIQFLRRDRRLTIEELALAASVDVDEIVRIEFESGYVPCPRSVRQLAKFFGLPQRTLLELSNVTKVDNEQLREAAHRFAANASKVAELSHQERAALNEFVEFLGTHDDY